MKQSLQLNLGQHLTMTPQLQQAIRLLQLSTLELQVEIQQAIETNPLLEAEESFNNESGTQAEEDASNKKNETVQAEDQQVNTNNEEIPNELPVDSSWDEIYQTQSASSSTYDPDNEYDMLSQKASTEGLKEHLIWQMELARFDDIDFLIAETIIDSINDDGYLTCELDEILKGMDNPEIELDEVVAVLHRIQSFDPPGVAARNPQECLLIQLQQLKMIQPENNIIIQAIKLVDGYMDLLANQDFAQIKRRLKYTDSTLKETIELIRSLTPRPGNQITASQAQYIVPDVFVKKYKNTWHVDLNIDSIPKIKINAQYANLIKRADSSTDNTYLKNHLQEAKWFLKSLQSRSETLLKVARCIVDKQQNFFNHGDEAMKPMVLREIAEAVEMHESTISRVTSQKYMHTSRGIFEFKYFFSSHVSTKGGGECSATAIRALIKKLVAAEKPHKPLSDSKIAILLADQGINVARRTIAKYREAISIPPSNERKRLL